MKCPGLGEIGFYGINWGGKRLEKDFKLLDRHSYSLVAGEGFEPSKAEPGDLQSPPIGRSGNPPGSKLRLRKRTGNCF